MKKTKVFFHGSENTGWAIDEDLQQLKAAMSAEVIESSLREADLVISVSWWHFLQEIQWSDLKKDAKILHFLNNHLEHELQKDGFGYFWNYVDIDAIRSKQASEAFESLGKKFCRVNYYVDREVFRNRNESLDRKIAIEEKYNIPKDVFLIGSFQRDSEGSDLQKPKLQKGADYFLEIIDVLYQKRQDLHILLAGPRRHWIIRQLKKRGIPYTYIGQELEGDDNSVNILPRDQLNELYGILDLYVVASRWEGGPYAILESLATGCHVISSPVGQAEDALDERYIFRSISEAVDKVQLFMNADSEFSKKQPLPQEYSFNYFRDQALQCLHFAQRMQPSLSGKRPGQRSVFHKISDRFSSPIVIKFMGFCEYEQKMIQSLAAHAPKLSVRQCSLICDGVVKEKPTHNQMLIQRVTPALFDCDERQRNFILNEPYSSATVFSSKSIMDRTNKICNLTKPCSIMHLQSNDNRIVNFHDSDPHAVLIWGTEKFDYSKEDLVAKIKRYDSELNVIDMTSVQDSGMGDASEANILFGICLEKDVRSHSLQLEFLFKSIPFVYLAGGDIHEYSDLGIFSFDSTESLEKSINEILLHRDAYSRLIHFPSGENVINHYINLIKRAAV